MFYIWVYIIVLYTLEGRYIKDEIYTHSLMKKTEYERHYTNKVQYVCDCTLCRTRLCSNRCFCCFVSGKWLALYAEWDVAGELLVLVVVSRFCLAVYVLLELKV